MSAVRMVCTVHAAIGWLRHESARGSVASRDLRGSGRRARRVAALAHVGPVAAEAHALRLVGAEHPQEQAGPARLGSVLEVDHPGHEAVLPGLLRWVDVTLLSGHFAESVSVRSASHERASLFSSITRLRRPRWLGRQRMVLAAWNSADWDGVESDSLEWLQRDAAHSDTSWIGARPRGAGCFPGDASSPEHEAGIESLGGLIADLCDPGDVVETVALEVGEWLEQEISISLEPPAGGALQAWLWKDGEAVASCLPACSELSESGEELRVRRGWLVGADSLTLRYEVQQ